MKKVNSKKELPVWFDLKNYDAIYSLSDISFFEQLNYRFQLQSIIDYTSIEGLERIFKNGIIINDSSFLDELELEVKKDINKYIGKSLSAHGGVEPMSVWSFIGLEKSVNSYREKYEGDDFFLKTFKNGKHISLLENEINDNIYISIDLSMNDELLIHDLKKLLPEWRKELNVTASDNTLNLSWPVIRKRIIEYCILPLIDLKIWELKTESKISNGVLAVALFPEGDYDSINIAQTIKPFAEKLLDYSSIEKYRREISS